MRIKKKIQKGGCVAAGLATLNVKSISLFFLFGSLSSLVADKI
jgi:hypothetical protein